MPLLFVVDSLDPWKRGYCSGSGRNTTYFGIYAAGVSRFKHVEFVETAERLYVRETRHIMGEYRLTITDVLENRDHGDRIAHGSYPVDIQPSGPNDLGNVIGKPAIYSIPFRCLVPLKIDNLLVVGRSASYDSLAHGSARVVPVGMAVGEAGVWRRPFLAKRTFFREMTSSPQVIKAVQEN